MQTWQWILFIVVALAAVAGVIYAIGLARARKRQVTFTTDKGKPETPAEKKTKYAAGGSISLSTGSVETPKPAADRPVSAQPPTQPAAESAGEDLPTSTPALEPEPEPVAEPESEPGAEPKPEPESETVVEPESTPDAAPVPEVTQEPEPTPSLKKAVEPETASEPTPQLRPEPTDIAPAEGRLSRLRGRLARSQSSFGKSLLGLLGSGGLDEDSWTDVEDTLLLADLGAQASAEVAEYLRAQVAQRGVSTTEQARALLREVLIDIVDPSMDRAVRALPHDGRPSVVLVVGVNGTGKTTTTGKLARVLVSGGRQVVLGAADTFRAAAAEQLTTWAERTGSHVVRAEAGTDPAAVAFDAVKYGIDAKADAVLIDTAGRLHTKTGLMDELGKVKRVVGKLASVDEVLLVLDATTGQNGLVQARVFADVVDVTGVVLTKLDGTAKGGIVVAVQRALGVPVKLVGLGEGPDDLAPFEPAAFVDALLGD